MLTREPAGTRLDIVAIRERAAFVARNRERMRRCRLDDPLLTAENNRRQRDRARRAKSEMRKRLAAVGAPSVHVQDLNRVLESPAGPFLGSIARPTEPHAVIFGARARVWSAESGPVSRWEIRHLRRPRVAEQGADPGEILLQRRRHHGAGRQSADHIARPRVASHRPDTGSYLLDDG